MADDPYATLGVSRTASEDDVRRAFRKLAKEFHPDISKGNEERFRKVSSAYEIIGDPVKRRAFDRGEIDARGEPRHAGYRQYARGARASAGAGAGGTNGAGAAGYEEFGFGDIFSDIFGSAGQRAGARANYTARGQDVRYTLEVDFLEAVLGATKRVTLPSGGMLDLNVPAGVTDGQVLRLKGKGQRGAGGAESGDALVEIRVRSHPQFTREADDILIEVPITIDEAVLGAKVEVPTISGRVQLTIPKGTS
ncbi:MAG: DnaJ C-terminal domain-containing protein, partial [Hyphomicrobium sp.]